MAKLRDEDIVFDIIVRLPVKSILQFRCVSKAWCKLLKDPHFVKRHLSHAVEMNKFSVMMLSGGRANYHCSKENHTLAYDPLLSMFSERVRVNFLPRNASLGISIWGTCNGLVCVTPTYSYEVVLWNPATKEFKEIPTVPTQSANEFSYCKYALGYDEEIDDFKVVSFVGSEDYKSFCEVQVYSLNSNSWRRLENIRWVLCAGDLSVGQLVMAQVSANGATHWLGLTDSKPGKVIASFDFKDERFNEMPLPSFWGEYAETKLCSLGESLCLHGSVGGHIDVWEMKEYGVTESWAKLFTINKATIGQISGWLVPLQFVKNGEVLLGYDTVLKYHLDLYDPKCGTSINLKALTRDCYATTFAYMESLVTLNSGTYAGQPEIKRKRLQRPARTTTVDLDSIISGARIGRVEEQKEEIAKEIPASPRSVSRVEDRSPQKSCEILDKCKCYVEKCTDLKRRKLDIETRKLDLETRKIDLEIRKLDVETRKLDLEARKLDLDTKKLDLENRAEKASGF